MTLKSHLRHHLVHGLTALFASAAMAGQASVEPTSQPNDLTRFIHQQIRNGIHGIGVGENHTNATMPAEIRQALAAFKAEGGTTVYIEWLPYRNQDLLDRVAKGDEAAMHDLRAIFEYTFGATNDTAQIRYDFVREAQRIGLRVIGIDVPGAELYRHQSFSPKSSADRDRLVVADPYMTGIIRNHDDGKPFIFIVGMMHTMASRHVREAGMEYGGPMRYSAKGGVDARLKALGIPVVTIDIAQDSGPVRVMQSRGVTEGFTLRVPEDKAQNKRIWGLAYRGMILGLDDILSDVVTGASAPLKAHAVFAAQNVAILRTALDRCADKEELKDLIVNMKKSVLKVASSMPHGNRRDMVEYMATNIGHPAQGPRVARDHPYLCEPAAAVLWRGPEHGR